MRPVVLVGHRHDCPLHGAGTVVTGSANYTFNGKAVARVGDRISCGALIISGSTGYYIEGKAVARQGDHTDHGGVLIDGDTDWLLE
ncbi:PAAR domain-containing protein [Pseudomonas sp. S 311-6]|uniref:PAAR domain-containing protein n=1 Tax=Pseudomonas TaxID=286 RepID=UPI002097965A|nr:MULTISPECIES: PAAR domain-containing protein [Pseudomonas]MCO7568267.1 PAAR domain-containing protein [Pseudomonas mosselii]MCO7617173.1 PAAR domain-containing protein [Pseudomonas guariconensis]MCO7643745.1 PAAR domain-containing protein [Pseudomonas sp. S 311-6]